MSELPKHVDTIIIGTGLTNSIISAACSRIGKPILHLDENCYYGDQEASFTFQQLTEWITQRDPDNACLKDIPEDISSKSRMFCIDLTPKFLFSTGDMVDLLVQSNVSRYHEFKNNIRILCLTEDNDIHIMPCRRNDVFTSPILTNLMDKRRLMKFIESCAKYSEVSTTVEAGASDQVPSDITDNADKPIGEYLEERGLKPVLRDYIINSIAMVKATDSTILACKQVQKFMIAVERYGRSPFLFPLYGCGEFPQSFCRLSAVFGGIYCLSTQISAIDVSRSQDTAESRSPRFKVLFNRDVSANTVTSENLIISGRDAKCLRLAKSEDRASKLTLSRAILITNKSIVSTSAIGFERNESDEYISFLRMPSKRNELNQHTVFLMELNSSALVCPRENHLIYLWTQAISDDAEQDLKPTLDRIFKSITPQLQHDDKVNIEGASIEKPAENLNDDGEINILWKYYFQQTSGTGVVDSSQETRDSDSNLFITGHSFDDIDYTGSIREAERVFKRMYPDDMFLPRAPDPDEIIHFD